MDFSAKLAVSPAHRPASRAGVARPADELTVVAANSAEHRA